ncbi:hypothetical protein G8C92_28425 [Paenibacillus donghaensis]|uniref:hypothetical protein n=1 Tax=Paenibacillus donghaensis TaxID=414771 RepID=UPI0018836EFB|nr:hypothetical protein [Paenibacillus donghaensis]MBE9917930.1 hypothetical protein [Paenibacillus donghaensis]
MVPYKVVLAVREPEYLERLLHYAYASEYGTRMHIIGFTRAEPFLEYINGGELPDLAVGDKELLGSWLREGGMACSWRTFGASGDEATEVLKYQPLPELLEALLRACQKKGGRSGPTAKQGGGAVTIGFVSAAGGCGKTTAAVNMAKQLGGLGLSVFYLNVEAINSSAVFPRQNRKVEDAQGLPNLLYEMKAAQETKNGKSVPVDSFVVHHPAMKCDWFDPVHNRNEILQLGKEDVLALLGLLAQSSRYDIVIADTDSGMNARTDAVIDGCSHLIWMLLDDLIHMYKIDQQLAYMERSSPEELEQMMAKSRFIVNRYVGSLANALPESIREIDGVLPYIPSWKQIHNEELLLSSPIFQRDILKLCRELLGGELAEAAGVRAYG